VEAAPGPPVPAGPRREGVAAGADWRPDWRVNRGPSWPPVFFSLCGRSLA